MRIYFQVLSGSNGVADGWYVDDVAVTTGVQKQLTGMTLSNGVFHFTLNGPVGNSYVIQVSTNMVNWLPLFPVTIPVSGSTNIAGDNMSTQPCRYYRAVPLSVNDIFIPATSGVITAPFIITNGYVFQPVETGVSDGGRAVYSFTTIQALGNYIIEAVVNAPDGGTHSFYMNIDAEPEDPYMIWDVPVTSSFMQQTVSWRGNGTPDNNQFVPQVFILNPGTHQLIIRGRGAHIQLQSITLRLIAVG